MPNDTWYILGAGSIGCLWAASLCHKGASPRLILRESSYQQFARKRVPLKLSTPDQTALFDVDIVSPETINSPINRLIVCTKAQDALAALNSVKAHLADNCQILLLYNGMGSQQTVRDAMPTQTVWAGSSTDGAYLAAPFEVYHAGRGNTWIGSLRNDQRSEPGFDDLCSNFRLNVSQCDAIEQKLWEKLAINSCINGLTALFNCRNGELLDNGEKQVWLDQLIIEASSVLAALEIPATSLREKVHGVCQNTASNLSSTCQDARRGRATELSFIVTIQH
ncbi:ketopantoate reductase family protein [Endozoicomonas sp. SCSIO W0465]|uniref:ketopantoate reductase family protein n=1 Tax=Endozoicomonas sp. SCSIO W0465 TaxID=2918516 RepID=UPI00207573B0|nr:2-dehydropantoate 2-reductase [Endozoicomonas sp. SCSIO W0465]USE37441.1 2-dehydropantoate 2-reductase [Endozoicomonas sp. SCSIO W0465]